tara:strand:+ start:417 stop:686 length:270 start_codon:yes stop_codon:yes gene_type:complete
MSVFKFDEEIELSNFKDFELIIRVNFKHQDPNGQFWGLTKNGYMIGRSYACKIEPKVKMYFADSQGYAITHESYQISKKLADTIKAGNI